jgi:hypothetical protein
MKEFKYYDGFNLITFINEGIYYHVEFNLVTYILCEVALNFYYVILIIWMRNEFHMWLQFKKKNYLNFHMCDCGKFRDVTP